MENTWCIEIVCFSVGKEGYCRCLMCKGAQGGYRCLCYDYCGGAEGECLLSLVLLTTYREVGKGSGAGEGDDKAANCWRVVEWVIAKIPIN